MKYWKTLEIPGFEEAQRKLLKYVRTQTTFMNGPHFWNQINPAIVTLIAPELKSWLASLDTVCTYATVLYIHRPTIEIHRDSDSAAARVNIPLLNTENTHTVFYKTETEPKRVELPNGQVFWEYDPAHCVEVTRTEILKPTIIRVDQPHQVLCTQPVYPRMMLSLKLKRDPVQLMD